MFRLKAGLRNQGASLISTSLISASLISTLTSTLELNPTVEYNLRNFERKCYATSHHCRVLYHDRVRRSSVPGTLGEITRGVHPCRLLGYDILRGQRRDHISQRQNARFYRSQHRLRNTGW